MEDNNGKLYEALAMAQAEFESLKGNKGNTYFKSKYATLDVIETATRPSLTKNGLSVMQFFRMIPDSNDMILVTRLAHKSGEYIESHFLIVRGGKDDQKIGSSITYARRYSYQSIICITADLDDDGNSNMGENEASEPEKRTSKATERKENPAPVQLITPAQLSYISGISTGKGQIINEYMKKCGVKQLDQLPKTSVQGLIDELTAVKGPSALAGV